MGGERSGGEESEARVIDVIKAHGSQNDIFLVDGLPDDLFGSTPEALEFVARLCDRDGPFGGDGIYFIDDTATEVRALFFNPDGSPAELCGNGMRCVGRLLLERRETDTVSVRVGSGTITARWADDLVGGPGSVGIDLPAISFAADQVLVTADREYLNRPIPVLHDSLAFTAVSVPNPHLVAVVDTYRQDELADVAGKVLRHPEVFPYGVNVSFIQPLGSAELFVRTYERGAGLTPSCGTGVIGSRAAYSKAGLADPDERIRVRNIGGPCACYFRDDHGAWSPTLEGNATYVYRATTSLSALRTGAPSAVDTASYLTDWADFDKALTDNTDALTAAGIAVTTEH